MRSIHILVPIDRINFIDKVLTNLKISYTKLSDAKTTLFILTVPDEKVEEVIDAIKKVGVGSLYGSYQVYAPEFATVHEEKRVTLRGKRAAREEILSDIKELAELNRNYILYSIFASVIAALGLLTDNLVMIIASMIIAPYIGPILGTSLGIVLNRDDLRHNGVKSESVGILLAILTGFVFTMITPFSTPTGQIMIRANPTYYDVIFAIAAGLAVALSVVSVASMVLVGVAIAASLVPPATNIGIGLSFALKGVPEAYGIIVGSSLLLLINILAITTMCIVFFWFEGITPGESIRKQIIAKKVVRNRLIVVFIAFLVVSAPVIYATFRHYQQITTETKIKSSVVSFINSEYPSVEIIDVSVTYFVTMNLTKIHLSIGVENMTNEIYELPDRLAQNITSVFHVKTKVYITISLFSSGSFSWVQKDWDMLPTIYALPVPLLLQRNRP